MSSLSDPAVRTVLTHHRQWSPGSPVRSVVAKAAALGFDVAVEPWGDPPALRLVRRAACGRAVTLLVDGS